MAVEVAIYGGANIDEKWRALSSIDIGSSSSGQRNISFGGVARNIAEALSRLDASVGFVSRVGDDEYGYRSIDHLKVLGISTKFVSVSSRFPTGKYCAFMNAASDLVMAMTDLRIYSECLPAVLMRSTTEYCSAKVSVLDTDLPNETLLWLCQNSKGKIWLTVTCMASARRLEKILSHVDALFLNERELAALSGRSIDCKGKLIDVLAAISLKPSCFVVVTCGRNGAYLAKDGRAVHFETTSTKVVDVTGAGDAVLSGTLFGCLQGYSIEYALTLGIKLARLTIQCRQAVLQTLNRELLLKFENSLGARA